MFAGMAAMNVYAFTAQASGPWMTAAGVALGLAIPALIFAFIRRSARHGPLPRRQSGSFQSVRGVNGMSYTNAVVILFALGTIIEGASAFRAILEHG
jgi:NO-binding membrane sensor protein with MHYT domain